MPLEVRLDGPLLGLSVQACAWPAPSAYTAATAWAARADGGGDDAERAARTTRNGSASALSFRPDPTTNPQRFCVSNC